MGGTAAAWRPGRVAGGGHFRTASGAVGNGGMGHRTEKYRIAAVLPVGAPGLDKVCRSAGAVTLAFLCPGSGSLLPRAVRQDNGLHAAGGDGAGVLVAKAPASLAAGGSNSSFPDYRRGHGIGLGLV